MLLTQILYVVDKYYPSLKICCDILFHVFFFCWVFFCVGEGGGHLQSTFQVKMVENVSSKLVLLNQVVVFFVV